MMLEIALAAAIAAKTPPAHPPVCEVNPDLCRSTAKSVVVPFSSEIARINVEVNADMVYREDAPGTDVWTVGAYEGDCEDFVLAKRAELLARGIPVEATRIALLWVIEGGEHVGHAVLLVETDRGTVALDNPRVGNPSGGIWAVTSVEGMRIESVGTKWLYVPT